MVSVRAGGANCLTVHDRGDVYVIDLARAFVDGIETDGILRAVEPGVEIAPYLATERQRRGKAA